MRFYWIVQGLLWTLILLCLLNLSGCAAYTVVSVTSWGTTGKGMADHGASLVSGADCNAAHLVMRNQDYYCEVAREPGTTYNRNSF
jgi:hypothetical protein